MMTIKRFNIIDKTKCESCIGKYEYKTSVPCRYCKWNTEAYWDREDFKMVEDNYQHIKQNNNNLPY